VTFNAARSLVAFSPPRYWEQPLVINSLMQIREDFLVLAPPSAQPTREIKMVNALFNVYLALHLACKCSWGLNIKLYFAAKRELSGLF
jgi:hypothetical protein